MNFEYGDNLSFEAIKKRSVGYIEADTFLRARDGMQFGETIPNTSAQKVSNVLDEEFLDIFSQDWEMVSTSEMIGAVLSDQDFVDDLADQLYGEDELSQNQFYEKVGMLKRLGLVANIVNTIRYEDLSISTPRRNALRSILERFYEKNPTAVLNPNEDKSFSSLLDFMKFYESEIEESMYETNVVEMVENHRHALIETLHTNQFSRLLPKPLRDHAVEAISRVPIVVIDPLHAEIDNSGEQDYMGWFRMDRRTCFIDPVTIANQLKQARGAKVSPESEHTQFDQLLELVVFHELWHAATVGRYQEITENNRSMIVSKPIVWPKSIHEAVTEKLAQYSVMANHKRLKADITPIQKGLRESTYRSVYGAGKYGVLHSNDYLKVMDKLAPTYREYRLGLDAIMQAIDWSKGGATLKQAETLLIRAFVEPTSSNSYGKSELPHAYRKEFMALVNACAHPGIFNKLAAIETLIGHDAVLDIVTSPNFDPGNAEHIPWLTSTAKFNHLSRLGSKEQVERSKKRLNRMRMLTNHEQLISQYEELLESTTRRHEDLLMLQTATDGLSAWILSTYGGRNYQVSRNEMLDIAIFGGHYKKRHHVVDAQDFSESLAAFNKWRQQKSKYITTN